MLERCAVINPGSSSWWLLTLTPILYYDRVRVSTADLESIHEQEGKSYYNLTVSRILTALERYAEEEVVIRDNRLPARGRSIRIQEDAKSIADRLLQYAAEWSPKSLALVRPSELKRVMMSAYSEWIAYNKSKASVMPETDPLKKELLERQIPRSQQSLRRIQTTAVNKIVDLLNQDVDLYTVFVNIIRNAYLICTIPNFHKRERLYDVLVEEFLPAVRLVQRYLVFVELPERINEIIGFDTLIRMYDFRMKRISATASGTHSSPENIVVCAFKERKRFSTLRKRLAELDSLIRDEGSDIDESWIGEIISIARELHRTMQQIDKAGTAFMWTSGAYFLQELLSTLDPVLGRLLKSLIVNPLTTKLAKEGMKNLYLATKGIKAGASPAIAAVRDYVGYKHVAVDRQSYSIGPGTYEFWI